MGSLQRLGDRALGAMQTRLELFAIELQEEKCRFVQTMLLTSAVITLTGTALILLTLTVVVLFWESARTAVLCGLTLLYGVTAGLACWRLFRHLSAGAAFRGTLAELAKDRACFQTTSGVDRCRPGR